MCCVHPEVLLEQERGQGAMCFSIWIQMKSGTEDKLTGVFSPSSDPLLLFEPSLPSQLGRIAMQRIPAGMQVQAVGSRITHLSADQPGGDAFTPITQAGLFKLRRKGSACRSRCQRLQEQSQVAPLP